MSRFFNDYNQYLGSQRCCNLKTQGNPGPQGPTGPAMIGPRGNTGPEGASFTGPTGRGCRGPTGEPGPAGGPTGQAGPTGGSPWSPSYYQGVTGYTGTGYTGDVMVFGALYVKGGIDPTYLALEPQPSGPAGFTNPLWVDNSGNLRSDKILLQSGNAGINCSLSPYGMTGSGPINLNADSISLNTTGNNIGINSGTSVNIIATDGVYLTASNDPMTLTSASLMTITGNDGLTMTANNNPMTLSCVGAAISMTASDDIGLTTALDAISLTAGLNINLNALNVNSYNYSMPICFETYATDVINYGSGQALTNVFTTNVNFPPEFFVETPSVGYTSTKWRIGFTLQTWNAGGQNNLVDKALAFYIDFQDQATNFYTPTIFTVATPYCKHNNNSTWTAGGTNSEFQSHTWTDYIDFTGLVGTSVSNLPLKLYLYMGSDNPLNFTFKLLCSFTRTNVV